MSTPNLDELIGAELAQQLVSTAGGLIQLSKLSDTALRHLGSERFVESAAAAAQARQLHGGLLVTAPIFTEAFGQEELDAIIIIKAARKALALLGRRCSIVIKVDAAGASADGSTGRAEAAKLRESFLRLQAEGKVSEEDTQALAVPHVFVRGAVVKSKRGGLKERRRREALQETAGVVERNAARVRMGVSEEVQLQDLLQREDIRGAYAKEREQQLAKETRKRGREEVHDEYDDLLSIAL